MSAAEAKPVNTSGPPARPGPEAPGLPEPRAARAQGLPGAGRRLRAGLGRRPGYIWIYFTWIGYKLDPTNTKDFSLSPGCFGTDIIQKCTKWCQMGVHGLKLGQIFAKFRCESFLV